MLLIYYQGRQYYCHQAVSEHVHRVEQLKLIHEKVADRTYRYARYSTVHPDCVLRREPELSVRRMLHVRHQADKDRINLYVRIQVKHLHRQEKMGCRQ